MAKTKLPKNDLYVGDNQVVSASDGALYQKGTKLTSSAAELNAISGIGAATIAVLTSAGTESNGDIVIEAPFEPDGMIIQGLQSSGAPRAFDTAVYDDGDITISVTTGTANDVWSVIIWA